MQHLKKLLVQLSDGRFHSGRVLGATLEVSRARIWQHIKELSQYGLMVESVPGRGYRLTNPISLLDIDLILSKLSLDAKSNLGDLELLFSLESTNTYLMNKARAGAASGSICLAEHQSAGRGRRGSSWVSPLGRNIYLSLLWRFDEGPARLSGLSLIIAMAVVDALKSLDIIGLAVKWPNDIFSAEGKVGGVLMEVAGEHSGPSYVVIGIGLNVGMPRHAGKDIAQSWANIPVHDIAANRSEIAASMINHLFAVLKSFQADGAAPFLRNWKTYDLIDGASVDLHLHDRVVSGVAQGIDERGFLVVASDEGIKHYSSGEVTLRARRGQDDIVV